MSDMDFFRHLRLRRESFEQVLDLIHRAYGEQPSGASLYFGPRNSLYLTLCYLGTQSTYQEISEMFGVSQTAVFECVQRVIDVLCDAGKNVFCGQLLMKFLRWSRSFYYSWCGGGSGWLPHLHQSSISHSGRLH
ncbi:hypothetical protein E2C01_084225 [Portunus trituberculatus]|uniref:Nuclease HARBI1 n=1 Tax=Portunus trituberculatus TaxID=210409 RepID=A0A5B7J6W5_PORTR|nr:hypothetical protein [Portunus trituberculatus]